MSCTRLTIIFVLSPEISEKCFNLFFRKRCGSFLLRSCGCYRHGETVRFLSHRDGKNVKHNSACCYIRNSGVQCLRRHVFFSTTLISSGHRWAYAYPKGLNRKSEKAICWLTLDSSPFQLVRKYEMV